MASATSFCCWALLPVTRRDRILARSDMNRRSRLTSFQSTYSILSEVRTLTFFLARRLLSLFLTRRLALGIKISSVQGPRIG